MWRSTYVWWAVVGLITQPVVKTQLQTILSFETISNVPEGSCQTCGERSLGQFDTETIK
jgi:S-ribosylhomocysteine lyase LuxS involved in autoinducer biosynthesis